MFGTLAGQEEGCYLNYALAESTWLSAGPTKAIKGARTMDLITAEPHRADLGKCQAAPMG
jgi:hypothetical protein